jgi:hypothetical protein
MFRGVGEISVGKPPQARATGRYEIVCRAFSHFELMNRDLRANRHDLASKVIIIDHSKRS